ncbi:MAG: hypothetical protein CSA58_02880 [Micrococcales bacterium]|nr:MAG: hypothetical protein CSB46_02725 [Micrococcales bacterium]PIE27680.1 MAG: hypothetical protein CSA58_02880 [Micrococcales bacterium]
MAEQSTTSPQEILERIQAQTLEAIRSYQQAALEQMKNLTQYSMPMPAVPDQVKKMLMDPAELVDRNHDFARQVLDLNTKFAHQIIDLGKAAEKAGAEKAQKLADKAAGK